jgi:hypothetical protein
MRGIRDERANDPCTGDEQEVLGPKGIPAVVEKEPERPCKEKRTGDRIDHVRLGAVAAHQLHALEYAKRTRPDEVTTSSRSIRARALSIARTVGRS